MDSPSSGAPKNAMADLLDLDFGSSEPAYTSPPNSSMPVSNNGPNYSADLFDMSSDMPSNQGVFGGMGMGMGGMGGMGGMSSPPAQHQQATPADPFGNLGAFGAPPQQKPATTQSSTVNDLLDLF